MVGKAHRVAAVAVALAFSACSDLGPEKDAYQTNKALWESVGPRSYVYAVRRGCFCPVEAIGPVRVTVVDGVPRTRIYVESGEAVDPLLGGSFPTVAGLFQIIGEAIELPAHQVDVTYDPVTGMPTDIYIDYSENTVDEETSFTVTEDPQAPPTS